MAHLLSLTTLRRASVAVLLAALAVFALSQQPSIVRAVAAFTSRTHLIVRESRIKQLSAALSQIPSSPVTVALYERARDGSLSDSQFLVPPGQVFVLTDVRVMSDASLVTDIRANGVSRYGFAGTSLQLAAGLVFDPGTLIDCVVSARSGVDVIVEVLGYEVEAESP